MVSGRRQNMCMCPEGGRCGGVREETEDVDVSGRRQMWWCPGGGRRC